jgi:predicted nucleic acid-binding protein
MAGAMPPAAHNRHRKVGPAHGVLARNRRQAAVISIITLGELAEGFVDPRALVEFLAPFRVVTLSRAIAWRTAALQSSLSRRLGENDAWIAATALSFEATLLGREKEFERVPRLDYLSFWGPRQPCSSPFGRTFRFALARSVTEISTKHHQPATCAGHNFGVPQGAIPIRQGRHHES